MNTILSFLSSAIKSSATSPTSKVGLWKFGLSALCIVAGIVFAATGDVPVAIALIGTASLGTASGVGSVLGADAPKTEITSGDTSKVAVKPQ